MHFTMSLRSALVAGLLLGNFAAAHVIGSDFQASSDALVEKREADNSVVETSFVERAAEVEDDFEDAPELEARAPKKGKGKKGKGKGKKGKGKGKKGKGKKGKA